MEIGTVCWGYLAKKGGELLRKIIGFFQNARGAVLEHAIWPVDIDGVRYYLVRFRIKPGTITSEFDRLETNGTLYRVLHGRRNSLALGEKLPNPFFVCINATPKTSNYLYEFFAYPAKEGPTEFVFKGKTKEELRCFESLQRFGEI